MVILFIEKKTRQFPRLNVVEAGTFRLRGLAPCKSLFKDFDAFPLLGEKRINYVIFKFII